MGDGGVSMTFVLIGRMACQCEVVGYKNEWSLVATLCSCAHNARQLVDRRQ